MKKSLLLTLTSLLVFNAVAWGEDCLLLNDGGEHSMSYKNSYIYEFSIQAPGKTFSIDMYKTMSTAIGSVYLYESADKSNWTKVKEIEVRDLDKNSYKSFSCNISESARYIKVDFPTVGSYKRYFKNAKVVQSKFLRVDKTSIDFGSLLLSQQSEQTVKVSYSATSGTVTSDNSAFIVSSGTAGNADCGKYGDQNITITFKPTTIGDFSGTVNIGGNTVTVEGKCVLPAPTLSNTAKGYTTANLSWNSVGGATGYRLYNNGSKFGEDMASTQTSIDLTGLAMHTAYKFTITALSGSVESNPSNEVSITTDDLAASAYINVSNASYSSVDAQWAAIPDATGYYIVSNNGVVNVFEGHDVTSGTLVGLMPNNTYMFTVYGMYGEEVSLNGKTSGEIKTLEPICRVEEFDSKEIESKGGFDWNDKYSAAITTIKNQATISFSFEITTGASGKEFFVQESADGSNWTRINTWSSDSKEGSGQVTLTRGNFMFRFVYSGNFGATISNISAMQSSYLEIPETIVDFGNVGLGETPSKDIIVNYSTMVGNVSKKGSDKFAVDKKQVGKDDCGYGSENIKVTFDASTVGQYTATVMVGSTEVTVKANVTLPVPTLEASEITYNSAKLSWNAVPGAEKYKLNFIGGNSIETTDTWSVCDTLKLHSSNQFTVQAYGGGQYTDPSNVVTVNTLDLAAPQNFRAEEVSYTSIPTLWDAVKDATGYRIQNETLYTYEDVDAGTTAYMFAALTDNTTYTISVTPIYDGELSNNKVSLTVTTQEMPYVPVSSCEQFRDVNERSMEAFIIGKSTDYNFDKAVYKSNVSFKARETGLATLHNTHLYAKVGDEWQKIWDEGEAGISSSYKTFTVGVPDGATAIRFYNNTGSSNWRNYSEVIVKRRNELEPGTGLVQFGNVVLGHTETRSITVKYSNLADLTALLEGSSEFSLEMQETKACEYGSVECKISYKPVTLDKIHQGSVTLRNGMSKSMALEGGVSKLPASPFVAAATGKSVIIVSWSKVENATSYKLNCPEAGIVNVDIKDTGDEIYSYNVTNLEENKEYTFTLTTMYGDIENESLTKAVRTYSTVKVNADGKASESTSWTLAGEEGKWNKDEDSFQYGSQVSITPKNGEVCYVYEKTVIGSETITANPAVFAISEPVTATIYYTDKVTDAPANFTATSDSKSSIELSWDAVECADTYNVYYKDGSVAKSGLTTTACTIEGLEEDTEYTFQVTAVNAGRESEKSAEASATTQKTQGAAKTGDGQVFQTIVEAINHSIAEGNIDITLLQDRDDEDIVLPAGADFTINGDGHKIGNVQVNSGAKLTIGSTLITGDLNIKTEFRNSGEVDPQSDNLQVLGSVSFDKILDPSGKVNNAMWYAVCVPFPVDIKDIKGVYSDGSEKELVYGYNYLIDEYDGNKRAKSGKGWVEMSASATLIPGKMYMIIADINICRFYKKDGAPIVSDLTTIQLQEFAASKIENQGWNAIGNSQLFHVGMNSETEFGQTVIQGTKAYDLVSLDDENFVVASPVFIQYTNGDDKVDLVKKQLASLRSSMLEKERFNLRIATSDSKNYADQLFLTASEYASADYTIGNDLAKMGDLTGVNVARIWMNGKGTNLCVMDAKLNGGVTEIPLCVFAPKSGNYKLYLNSDVYGLTLELLYNGENIHNFADGEFTIAFAKGTNSEYSLRVSVDEDAPIITDADDVDGIMAFISENMLYIRGLNSGAEYTVYNVNNKIATSVADGGVEQIALPLQGVYIVVSGETTIKLLNN